MLLAALLPTVMVHCAVCPCVNVPVCAFAIVNTGAGITVRFDVFDDVLPATEGWAKQNRHYWRRDWQGYVEFFMSEITTEPHSTKPYDELVEWGMQTDAETMLYDADAPQQVADEQEAIRLCRSLACPVLVIGGDQDKIVPPERARRIAELTSAELLVVEGGGHGSDDGEAE